MKAVDPPRKLQQLTSESRVLRSGPIGGKIDGRSAEGRFLAKVERELRGRPAAERSFTQTMLIRRAARAMLRIELLDEKAAEGNCTDHDARVYDGLNNACRLFVKEIAAQASAKGKGRRSGQLAVDVIVELAAPRPQGGRKDATLIERRNAMEFFRDQATERFEVHIGSPWRPRSGSKLSHRALTAAMIDSRDFLAARRRAETEVLMPPGPKIALTGGLDFNDHQLIWAKLDQVHAKHPDMVLLHGGSPKGAEFIAAKWATNRRVPQIAFRPDWTKHGKAAPFKRNDAMLETLPIGVLHFPGTGIQDNLADKAKKLGIPVWRFGGA